MTKLSPVGVVVAFRMFCAASSWADSATAATAQVVPARAPERKVSLEPKVAEPKPAGRVTFQSDPIADGAIIVVSLGSAGLLELINSTGEIRPHRSRPASIATS